MTAARDLARPAPTTAPTPGRPDAPASARRRGERLANEWLARAAWTVGRTGWPGLAGIALLLAAASFLATAHVQVAAEVEALRAQVAAARAGAQLAPPRSTAAPASATDALPPRAEMPAILRRLFAEAARAGLDVDAARYELDARRKGAVVRYQVAFPVTGPYAQIRAFLDAALGTMPEVGLSDLVLERKAIGEGSVEAQIRMTIYTRSSP